MDVGKGFAVSSGFSGCGCKFMRLGLVRPMNLEMWFVPASLYFWITACRRQEFPTFCGCNFACCVDRLQCDHDKVLWLGFEAAITFSGEFLVSDFFLPDVDVCVGQTPPFPGPPGHDLVQRQVLLALRPLFKHSGHAPFLTMVKHFALEISSADPMYFSAWTLNRDDAIFVGTDGVGVLSRKYVVVFAWYNFSACRRHILIRRAVCSKWLLPVRAELETVSDARVLDRDVLQCGWMRRLVEQLTSAAITLLAILQLSLWRLILYSCKLKGGDVNVDNLIRGGRKVTRGAPVKFWCAFMVTILATEMLCHLYQAIYMKQWHKLLLQGGLTG